MVKPSTRSKASTAKPPPRRANDRKKKLPRGFKECGNCKTLLHIHKYVCGECGFKHDMKKKKVDIIKKFQKITPKMLRSVIELNDFNDISDRVKQPHIYEDIKVEQAPQQVRRKRSRQSSHMSALHFVTSQNYSYAKVAEKISCMCPIFDDLLIAEVNSRQTDYNEAQDITVKAFGLENYHRVGQIYSGKTTLHLLRNKKIHCSFVIHEHVVSMKALGNRVALLTGRGTVTVIDLNINPKRVQEHPQQLEMQVELSAFGHDQFSVIEWVNSHSTQKESFLLAGSLMGHITVFALERLDKKIFRFINNAHFESVTSLSECPLSEEGQILFASGSYDGSVSVWNLEQNAPIFKTEASNRKLTSLLWDPGAKFIFIIRDQNHDSGVLACFFSILKSDDPVTLSDQLDYRLIRNANGCKALHFPTSQKLCLIDPYQSTLRVMELQQLRKTSLKRKKSKREDQQQLYSLSFDGQGLHKKEDDSNDVSQQKMNDKYLPLPTIADACQMKIGGVDYVWGVTYDGYVFQVKLK